MPTTANYALRYPDLTYAPNVPTDLANLAGDLDAALTLIAKPPTLVARQLTANTLSSGATTVLTNYNTPEIATLSGFTTSTGVWTCPTSATYDLTAMGSVAYASGATRIVTFLLKNGTAVIEADGPQSGSARTIQTTMTYPVACAVGDTISIGVVCVGASSSTDVSNAARSTLRIQRRY